MQAVIMAGGEGTRLRPITSNLPKPMVKVLNKPVMEYTVELLKKHEITDVGVTLMFLPQYIRAYFGSGEELGVNLSYFEEPEPLGTAGSVKNAEGFIKDTFIIISGDALTDIDITDAVSFHKSRSADVTIVLKRAENPLEYGVVLTRTDGRIVRFIEKPSWEHVVSDLVNTGIYIIEPHVLNKIPSNTKYDFGKDLFPALLNQNAKVFGYVTDRYWCDIGDTAAYRNAQADLLDGKLSLFSPANGICAEKNVTISKNAVITPPVYFGENTYIGDGSVVGAYTVTGKNCYIENSGVFSSLLLDGACIKNNADVSRAVLCKNALINGAVLQGENVVGENSVIDRGSVLLRGKRVWDNSAVDIQSVITADVRGGKIDTLWTDDGLCGVLGSSVTENTFSELARALARYKNVILAADGNNEKGVLKALSGVLAFNGINVYQCFCGVNAARYTACLRGFVCVYVSVNGNAIKITLIDETGLNFEQSREKQIKSAMQCAVSEPGNGNVFTLEDVDRKYNKYIDNSFPTSRKNVAFFTSSKYTHKGLLKNPENANGIFRIYEQNGIIRAIFNEKNERMKTEEYYMLRAAICARSGAKTVALPPYAGMQAVKYAQNMGLNVTVTQQHKGDAMHAVGNDFLDTAVLAAFDPFYFACAVTVFDFSVSENPAHTVCQVIPCPTNMKSRALGKLANTADCGDGYLRINSEHGSLTILPDNHRPILRFFATYYDTEYAADFSDFFGEESGLQNHNI